MAAAKDPVCGMEVDTSSDLKFEYNGETYYFCGRGCKLEFEEAPRSISTPTTNRTCNLWPRKRGRAEGPLRGTLRVSVGSAAGPPA